LASYCWWIQVPAQDTWQADSNMPSTNSILIDGRKDSSETGRKSTKKILPRKRRNNLPEVEENLRKLLEKLNEGKLNMIFSSEKGDWNIPNYYSQRRSKFIGVSKNGKNWQVLINVGNTKKYIGTYVTQNEAAIAYDFYSFALHGSKAKTNFTYTWEKLTAMIEGFLESHQINFDIFN